MLKVLEKDEIDLAELQRDKMLAFSEPAQFVGKCFRMDANMGKAS